MKKWHSNGTGKTGTQTNTQTLKLLWHFLNMLCEIMSGEVDEAISISADSAVSDLHLKLSILTHTFLECVYVHSVILYVNSCLQTLCICIFQYFLLDMYFNFTVALKRYFHKDLFNWPTQTKCSFNSVSPFTSVCLWCLHIEHRRIVMSGKEMYKQMFHCSSRCGQCLMTNLATVTCDRRSTLLSVPDTCGNNFSELYTNVF